MSEDRWLVVVWIGGGALVPDLARDAILRGEIDGIAPAAFPPPSYWLAPRPLSIPAYEPPPVSSDDILKRLPKTLTRYL